MIQINLTPEQYETLMDGLAIARKLGNIMECDMYDKYNTLLNEIDITHVDTEIKSEDGGPAGKE